MATSYRIAQKLYRGKLGYQVTIAGDRMGPQHIMFEKRAQAERFVREAKKGREHRKIMNEIWHLKPIKATQRCEWCGETFTPKVKGQIYCNPDGCY